MNTALKTAFIISSIMIISSERMLASKPAALTPVAEAVKPCTDTAHELIKYKQVAMINALSKHASLPLALSSLVAQYCYTVPIAWQKMRALKDTTPQQKVVSVVSLNPTDVVVNTEAGLQCGI